MTKYKNYEEHYEKWEKARKLVSLHNKKLIKKWESIPWWKFWDKPSFEEQRQIILDNWHRFEMLPKPRLMDYYPISYSKK